ncbi:MAG: Mth938-like domain-containing protein [Paucibacter sp.]|nr:Mth938-like domain-containing protein [Roseateles sp.]
MKFQLDEQLGGNAISRHDGQCVWVNGRPNKASLLVPWRGEVVDWGVGRFEDFAEAHFERVLALRPELVVLGTGPKLRFVSPALYRSLIAAGIGLETMDLGAACRTYNVLASEGRAVLAALLIEP